MGLIICVACGRQRDIEPVKRGKLRCSNCGAITPKIVYRTMQRVRLGLEAGDKDGIEKYEARARTLAGLKWIADQKGYKQGEYGWAAVSFKNIFGEWPNGESLVPPDAPQGGVMDWMKRRNAQYAKEMRAKEEKCEEQSGAARAGNGSQQPTPAKSQKSQSSPLMSAEDEAEQWR